MDPTTRNYALVVAACLIGTLLFGWSRYSSVQAQLGYWGEEFNSASLWLHPNNQHVTSVATITEHVGTVEGLVPSTAAPETVLSLSLRTDRDPTKLTVVEIPTAVLAGSFYVLQGDRGQELVSYTGFVGSMRAGARINLRFEQNITSGVVALTFGLITL